LIHQCSAYFEKNKKPQTVAFYSAKQNEIKYTKYKINPIAIVIEAMLIPP